jgi:hypothetical protein
VWLIRSPPARPASIVSVYPPFCAGLRLVGTTADNCNLLPTDTVNFADIRSAVPVSHDRQGAPRRNRTCPSSFGARIATLEHGGTCNQPPLPRQADRHTRTGPPARPNGGIRQRCCCLALYGIDQGEPVNLTGRKELPRMLSPFASVYGSKVYYHTHPTRRGCRAL